MKNKIVKKIVGIFSIVIVVTMLWQILVLKLLEKNVISTFIALIMICGFFAILGAGGIYVIRVVIQKIKSILSGESEEDNEVVQYIKSIFAVMEGTKKGAEELGEVSGRFKKLFGEMSQSVQETSESVEIMEQNTEKQMLDIFAMQTKIEEITIGIGEISKQMEELTVHAEAMAKCDEIVCRNL